MSTRAVAVPEESISPDLLAEIQDLDASEQATIASLIRQAKYRKGERKTIDDLSLVREFLRAEFDTADYRPPARAVLADAPMVRKDYPACEHVQLSQVPVSLTMSLEDTFLRRTSVRDYSSEPITLGELYGLLHYSYGVRKRIIAYGRRGFPLRFVPSSGGLQAAEIYFAANSVQELQKGLYHYNADDDSLDLVVRGYLRRKFVEVCNYQEWVSSAAIVVVITCDISRLYWKYGKRAYRMVHVDAGILAQNLHLVATALGLNSCMISGFAEEKVQQTLRIDGEAEFVILLMTVGKKAPRSFLEEEKDKTL